MHKIFRIENERIRYRLEYRNVIHSRLEFKTGTLLLVLPQNYSDCEEDILRKHKRWILLRHAEINNAIARGRKKNFNQKRNDASFRRYLIQKADEYFDELSVSKRALRFRRMKSKWASCSSRVITINTLMKYLPDRLINYVIYHEIVHIKERRHNRKFWNMMNNRISNTQLKEKDLMTYWFLIHNDLLTYEK